MRTIKTDAGMLVDIQVTDSGKVLMVIDGEGFALTGPDAGRIAEALRTAALKAAESHS